MCKYVSAHGYNGNILSYQFVRIFMNTRLALNVSAITDTVLDSQTVATGMVALEMT